MAKKKCIFGTILKLGCVAAATVAVYYKRNEIQAFLEKALEQCCPETPETEPVEETPEEESDIVIDATAKDAAAEETDEETTED